MTSSNPAHDDDELDILNKVPLFSEWLAAYRSGRLDREIAQKMADLVQQVRLLEKPGTITIKLKIDELDGGAMLSIEEDVTTKPPKPKAAIGHAFANDAGGMFTDDPARAELPFLATLPSDDTDEPARLPEDNE